MPIADILPLTPLQQGLLFHANTAQDNRDDVYAVQLDITLSGRSIRHRLREAVHTVGARHPNLVGPIPHRHSTSRCRSSRPIP